MGWDQGVVPAELQPRGTQASFNEAGNLLIDSQASSINVTALVGKKAILGCVVRNINNHSVSITIYRQIVNIIYIILFNIISKKDKSTNRNITPFFIVYLWANFYLIQKTVTQY